MAEVDELDLLIEHRDRTERFLAAKAEAQAKPNSDKAQDAWRQEKNAMREWRREWRDVREAFGAAPGTASPAPLSVKTKAKGA